MAAVDIVIIALLGAAMVCSVIELGISAYVVSAFSDVNLDNTYESRFDFLLFCSIWTILVVAFFLLYPMVSGRKSSSHGWLVPTTLILNLLTMIFWLAGFAAYADFWRGAILRGTLGAELAFAVILWLIFLALAVLNILTAMDVTKSDRLGYSPMRRNRVLP